MTDRESPGPHGATDGGKLHRILLRLLPQHAPEPFSIAPELREHHRRQIPFFTACRRGDLAAIQSALDSGLSANERGSWFTPLVAAVESGSIEAVELLLNHGAQVAPSRCPSTQRTALQVAVEREQEDMVVRLLAACRRPLPYHEVKLYWRKALRGERQDEWEDNLAVTFLFHQLLQTAVLRNNSPAIACALVNHGANPYRVIHGYDVTTVLHLAAMRCRPDFLAALLKAGVDPRETDHRGTTASQLFRRSHDCRSCDHFDEIRALLRLP